MQPNDIVICTFHHLRNQIIEGQINGRSTIMALTFTVTLRLIISQKSFNISEHSTARLWKYWSGLVHRVLPHHLGTSHYVALHNPLENCQSCPVNLTAFWLNEPDVTASHCARTTQPVKGRQCPGSLQAFRALFLLPAERWPPVNKTEPVLRGADTLSSCFTTLAADGRRDCQCFHSRR